MKFWTKRTISVNDIDSWDGFSLEAMTRKLEKGALNG